MIPGEYRTKIEEIEINTRRKTVALVITNTGDRPVQVGSHYHFFEVNRALEFDRPQAYGMRLNIPAGTAVRFEPGEQRPVELVEFGGKKHIYGLNRLTSGAINDNVNTAKLLQRIELWKGGLARGTNE